MSTEADIERKKKVHGKLVRKTINFPGSSNFGLHVIRSAKGILDTYSPEEKDAAKEILETALISLPPASQVFITGLYLNPMLPISILREVLDLYDASPLSSEYISRLGITDIGTIDSNLLCIIWLCSFYSVNTEKAKVICSEFFKTRSIPETMRIEQSNPCEGGSNVQGNNEQQIRTDGSFNAIQQQVDTLADTISRLSNRVEQNNGAQTPPNRQETPSRGQHRSYNSIGAIPVLRNRSNTPGNIAGLFKAFSHPSSKFSGTGNLTENLGNYHQSFMNTCKTFKLTNSEAFDNLYVLFKTGSEAARFYHKYVLNRAANIDEAFSMLYARFMSSERRDRLFQNWNNLNFSDFSSKEGATKLSDLREMCSMAASIQLQLGPSYRDDQHLRDTLLKACKEEKWAHRLATMPTHKLLDREESLARAITAEEDFQKAVETKKPVPAFPKDVNYNAELTSNSYRQSTHSSLAPLRNTSSSADRPGMPYRKYSRPHMRTALKALRAYDGKNPIRNFTRLLCRLCLSDEHLLRDCPKLTPTKRIQLVRNVFTISALNSASDECDELLDIIQDSCDAEWRECCSAIGENPEPSQVNWTKISGASDHYITDGDYDQTAQELAERAFLHKNSSTKEISDGTVKEAHQVLYTSKSASANFEGICIDNAAEKIVAGLEAYKRYCQHTNTPIDLTPSNETFLLGGKAFPSLGSTVIRFPIDSHGNYLEYETDVIDLDVPILFGLDKLKQHRWFTNEVSDWLIKFDDQKVMAKLVYKKGHLYLEWPHSIVLFTRSELVKIHRRFAHPSPAKLSALLKKAAPNKYDKNTRKFLDDIAVHCQSCQRMAPKPFVFQISMPEDIKFNHEVLLDLCWLEPRPHEPVLHMVDRGTRFNGAVFVEGESAEDIWNAFISCWVSIYIGFPNILSHDYGKLFTSKFFQNTCAEFGIITKGTPCESHNSLGAGERYHAPLRRIYKKIKIEHPGLSNKVTLSIAVHGLNNTANLEGLIPTLLVFGSVPKIPLGNIDQLPPTQKERFLTMEEARKEMERIVAEQRLKLASRLGTKGMDVFNISPGSQVLVYREKNKLWDGPFKLETYDNYKTAYVDTGPEVEPFSITAVKPFGQEDPKIGDRVEIYWPEDDKYYPGTVSSYDEQTKKFRVDYDDGEKEKVVFKKEVWRPLNQESHSNLTHVVECWKADMANSYLEAGNPKMVYAVEVVRNAMDPRFTESSRAEIQGLLDRGSYAVVSESDLPANATVLRYRVQHSIKTDVDGTKKYKTRLLIQGHRDPEKDLVVNEAPTLLRSSVRLILTLASTYGFPVWSRDVKQAFIQSKFPLGRSLYIKPPKKPDLMRMVNHLPDSLLQALKPIYGLTESPGYWWQTFKPYHTDELGMKQTSLDPCLFFKQKEGKLTGLAGTLVDDTLGAGSEEFENEEEEKSKKFDVKDKDTNYPMKFGGFYVTKDAGQHSVNQYPYANELETIDPKNLSGKQFAHLRGQLWYIASATRPDVAYLYAKLSQVKAEESTIEDAKLLNSAVNHVVENKIGNIFPALDFSSTVIRGYSDAGFASDPGLNSQLAIVILLIDKYCNAALIHYGSWKSRRVVRSVLAAELYAFVSSNDFCQVLRHDIKQITGCSLPIHLMTDSKSIFDTITKLSGVSEKRLMIDIATLRQSYAKGEITNIGHVLTKHNIADPLTKKTKSPDLQELLSKGKLTHPVNLWIVHEDAPVPNDI